MNNFFGDGVFREFKVSPVIEVSTETQQRTSHAAAHPHNTTYQTFSCASPFGAGEREKKKKRERDKNKSQEGELNAREIARTNSIHRSSVPCPTIDIHFAASTRESRRRLTRPIGYASLVKVVKDIASRSSLFKAIRTRVDDTHAVWKITLVISRSPPLSPNRHQDNDNLPRRSSTLTHVGV